MTTLHGCEKSANFAPVLWKGGLLPAFQKEYKDVRIFS